MKANGRRCYVYAAYDLSKDELLCMKAYVTRDIATTLDFAKQVMKLCVNKPIFVVDKAPWYGWVFEKLGLRWRHESFCGRNKVERVFGYLKQRSMLFYHNINVNLRSVLERMEKGVSDSCFKAFESVSEVVYGLLRLVCEGVMLNGTGSIEQRKA